MPRAGAAACSATRRRPARDSARASSRSPARKTTRPCERSGRARTRRPAGSAPCRPRRRDAPCRRARSGAGRSAFASSRDESLGIAEEQVGALVRGEAAGEADRQRVRVEGRAQPARAHEAAAARPSPRDARPTATRRRARTRARNRACPCPPRRRAARSSGSAIHVRACTPFVIEPIGASSTGRPGQRPCHISRDTSPCSAETPFACDDVRSAKGVSPKPSSPSWTRPSAANSSHPKPQRATSGPTFCSTSAASKTSLPAGTGVCVVNTVDARRRSQRLVAARRSRPRRARAGARAGGTPSGPRSCGRPSARLPSARRTRTPPTPSTSSCRSRCWRSPP